MKMGKLRLNLTRKKLIIFGIIIALLAFGFISFSNNQTKQLEFATVEKQDIRQEISAAGKLTGQNIINLSFQASGKLIFLNVKEGDKVAAGQILAGLQNTAESVAFQQAKNNLRDKQASVDKVLDDIHLFQYGQGGFANVNTENETMTQKQLRTTAEVARDNAADSLKVTQKNLSDTYITSPLSGIITSSPFVVGQVVGSSDTIIELADLSSLVFEAEVDETDSGKLNLGMAVEVTLDAYPNRIFSGTLDQISLKTKSLSSGATVVIAKVKFTDVNILFIDGLSGQASFILSEAKNSLSIPVEAMKDDNTVVIKTEKGTEERKVTKGISSDTDIEIKDGLDEDDKVVLNPN